MKRIIGIPTYGPQNKPPTAPQNLSTVVSKIDSKANELDSKIAQCEVELKKISTRLRSLPDGQTKIALKLKANRIFLRKKKLEEQSETFKQQSFNFDQTASAMQSAKDAVIVAKAMKSGVKELKKDLKKVDIDVIEDLQDELEQLFEKTEEVQDVFASRLSIPEDIDDQELEEQLELLGNELANDNDTSYLDAAIGPTRPNLPPTDQGPDITNNLMSFPNGGPNNTSSDTTFPPSIIPSKQNS